MAFTSKLTKMLAEAADVAHADGATMIAFVMKDKDKHGACEAMCMGSTNDPATMIAVTASLLDKIEEDTGINKKKLVKLMDKQIKSTVVAVKKGKSVRDIADADL